MIQTNLNEEPNRRSAMKKFVTKSELIETIKVVKGSSAVSIEVETEVDMRKTGNPYVGAVKLNTVAGLIGFDYENGVNNLLGKEDKPMEFKAMAHKWALPTDSKNLLTNKDGSKLYLRIKVQSAGSPEFFFNGARIEKALFAPFMPEHKKPATQAALDGEYVVRTYAIDSIRAMKILGDELVIVAVGQEKTEVSQPVNATKAGDLVNL